MSTSRIKLKLFTVVSPEFRQAFHKLLTDPAVVDPGSVAWKLARAYGMIEQHNENFAIKKREVARTLGSPVDPSDDTKGHAIAKEKLDEWNNVMTAEVNRDVELYIDKPIACQVDPLPKGSVLNALDLVHLRDVICPPNIVELPVVAPHAPSDANEHQAGADPSAPAQ